MPLAVVTPSQYVALYVLGAYAIGVAIVCSSRPNAVPRLLDIRPALSVQALGLAALAASEILWPSYPHEGRGEYARVALWAPAVGVGCVESWRAFRGQGPLLPTAFLGLPGRAGAVVVLAWTAWQAGRGADVVTVGVAGLCCACVALPLSWTRVSCAVLATAALSLTLIAWSFSPSSRTVLPTTATRIEETYVHFFLPPDWLYSLSADVTEDEARAVALSLGVPLPAQGRITIVRRGDCETVLEWRPPRLDYSEHCG